MKRFGALMLSLLVILSLCCGTASARASDYLRSYSATLFTGNNSGELRLDFDVFAKVDSTAIGVSRIDVYRKSDDSLVKIIMGSESNGLVTTGYSHMYSYYFNATAGVEYYTKVHIFAEDSTGGDARVYTTNSATAKS